MITYRADGSVFLQDERDPGRTMTLSTGMGRSDQDAAISAFFAQGGATDGSAI